MISDDPDLLKQAYLDITMRTRAGITLYLVIWLIVSLWSDIPGLSPMFFKLNTGLIALTMLLRGTHYFLVTRRPELNNALAFRCLAGMVLFSAAHWGLMSSWIIHSGEFPHLHYPFIIIIAAMAMGVTVNLSISNMVSQYYPILIFAPHLVLGLREGSGESLVLVSLATISIFYVRSAAQVIHDDYWSSIRNHRLVEAKAAAMEKLSITDQLTGLYNRLYFNKSYDAAWKLCSRLNLPLSLMIVDLDYFKKINDTYGHLAGDACLKKAAAVLAGTFKRDSDIVARFGGEEFVVVMPNTNQATAHQIAEKVLRRIAEDSASWQGQSLPITCSIGLAVLPTTHRLDGESLLDAADKALYRAKEGGRNRCCIAEEYDGRLKAVAG